MIRVDTQVTRIVSAHAWSNMAARFRSSLRTTPVKCPLYTVQSQCQLALMRISQHIYLNCVERGPVLALLCQVFLHCHVTANTRCEHFRFQREFVKSA